MSSIILIVSIVNLLLIITLYGRVGSIILFIELWWFFWLYISSLSISGLYTPTDYTYFLFMTMLSSVTIGCIINKLSRIVFANNNYSCNSNDILLIASKIYPVMFKYILPVVVLLFIKGGANLISADNYGVYREDALGLGGENILFGNQYLALIYSLVFKPTMIAGLFAGSILYKSHNKSNLLIVSSIIIILDSVMTMARFGMYYIMFTLITMLTIKFAMKDISFIKLFVNKLTVIIILIFGLAFYISMLRGGDDLVELFNQFIISYHTMSFTIVSKELNTSNSIINDTTYGLASLGQIENMFCLLLKRIGIDIASQSQLTGTYLHEFMLLGRTNSNIPIIANAFGSILFNLYRDGGIFFISLSSILYGYYLSKMSICAMRSSHYHMAMLYSLAFIGFFGIFQPVLSGAIIPAILILYFLFKKSTCRRKLIASP